MAPLVPDLLSNELNIVAGLLIGIAFGYVLEQAGFSSSRRLAGLFYGYDFTVLRVFFTAAITAMIGTLLLSAAGILDLEFVYVNPLFLGPALVGGAIMGLGFILGGYCPGTSVCAAAIGKKDAIVFVLGGFLGVFLYGEAYGRFAGFVNDGGAGGVKVYDSVGVSRGGFVLFVIAAAVLAFAVTSWIEKRVSHDAPSAVFPRRSHRLAAVVAVAFGVLLVILPDRGTRLLAQVADHRYQTSHPARYMTADELAFRLLDDDPRLLVVDLRSDGEHERWALPSSVSMPLAGLLTKEWAPLLGRRHTTKVFVDEDGSQALRAALLAQRLGYDDARVLQGGVQEFRHAILEYQAPTPTPDAALSDTDRFRSEARVLLTKRIEEARAKPAQVKKVVKKAQGGC
jgi:rhodanese-related sulfurtransferase